MLETPLLYLLVIVIFILMVVGVALYRLRARKPNISPDEDLQPALEELSRQLQQEKKRASRALAEAEKHKEIAKLAASISDEQANKLMLFAKLADQFRTPLTLTMGPLENALLGRYGKISAQMRKQVEVALRNARQLFRLVNQFHDISKLQSGQMELKPQRKKLVRFLREILMSFEEQAEKRKVQLSLETKSEDIEAYFDVDKMEEIFYHLFSNALKFTPKDGKVTATVSEEQEVVQILVRDSGKGIPEDELSQIFSLFRQSKESLLDRTGPRIGLSLVRDLVSLHGGNIEVKSEIGRGTEFVITLRKGKDHFAGMEITEDAEEPDETSHREMIESTTPKSEKEAEEVHAEAIGIEMEKILIVEDNADIRELLKDCLKGHYRITEASNGRDALEKVYEMAPDIIISDVLMPGMDGFDLCRTLKTDRSYQHIPVILLTAKGSEVMKIQGIEAGADAYITKPFSPLELLERIKNLSRQRPA